MYSGKHVEWFRYHSLSTHRQYAVTEPTEFLLNMFQNWDTFIFNEKHMLHFVHNVDKDGYVNDAICREFVKQGRR